MMVNYLSFKMIFNYLWVKESNIQVLVWTYEWSSRMVVSNAEAKNNAKQETFSQGFQWICLEGL